MSINVNSTIIHTSSISATVNLDLGDRLAVKLTIRDGDNNAIQVTCPIEIRHRLRELAEQIDDRADRYRQATQHVGRLA